MWFVRLTLVQLGQSDSVSDRGIIETLESYRLTFGF